MGGEAASLDILACLFSATSGSSKKLLLAVLLRGHSQWGPGEGVLGIKFKALAYKGSLDHPNLKPAQSRKY